MPQGPAKAISLDYRVINANAISTPVMQEQRGATRASRSTLVSIALVGTALIALYLSFCSATSEHRFVHACISHGQLPTSVCECLSRDAHSALPPDSVRLIVAKLEGDERLAASIREKIPTSAAVAAGLFLMKEPNLCGSDKTK